MSPVTRTGVLGGERQWLTYVALLRRPSATVAEVAQEVGLSPARVSRLLARLTKRQLAHRSPRRPPRYSPTPPDVAIPALVNQRQWELDRTLLAVPGLRDQYQRAAARADPAALIEVLSGPQIAYARFCDMMAGATADIMVFDRQSADAGTGEAELAVETPVLERGARCRAIYEVSTLDQSERLPYIRKLAALGEQARVLPQLPMKLIIADHRLALLPLATASEERWTVGVLAVHPSRLLDGLIALFEDHWARAVSLTTALTEHPSPKLSASNREMLSLLCTGIKDEAMARQLGVSPRTVNRRIIRLMATLGASSRFQAGVQAAKQGLV
jgi:DNA-binding NarL/FixJ family response regulator